jgi:predicted amidophosphoribosyltransferase
MATDETIRHLPPQTVPLCLNCLQPYDPLLHYCPKCGAAVGQLTPYIPFVSIGYQCEFWGRLWKKLWSRQQGHVLVRILGVVLILLFMPILLLAIPFVIRARQRPSRRGFEVLVEAEQKLASSSSPTSTPEDLPNDRHPNYSDRPRIKPR